MPRIQTGTVKKVRQAPTAKKRLSVGKIASVLVAFLMIGAVAVLAVKLIGGPKTVEEEPKIIPTDVIAGTEESSAGDETVVAGEVERDSAERHTVRFTFYDKPDVICTTANIKAGTLMKALGIEYETDKIVSVDSDAEITGDTDIDIKSVEYTLDYTTEVIPNDTKYVDDASMYVGEEAVSVDGYDGVKTYTYKCTLVNGVEQSRELVGEEITTEPVDRVINRGTAVVPTTPVTGGDTPGTIYTGVPENYLYYVDVRATCYCIVGTTATGLPTGDNVMAVDPNVIPLGSHCVVIGELGDYGHRIAADVGGGIKGNIIDIWVPEGTGFGWQNARVYVISEG